jgi:hypothetical protein
MGGKSESLEFDLSGVAGFFFSLLRYTQILYIHTRFRGEKSLTETCVRACVPVCWYICVSRARARVYNVRRTRECVVSRILDRKSDWCNILM